MCDFDLLSNGLYRLFSAAKIYNVMIFQLFQMSVFAHQQSLSGIFAQTFLIRNKNACSTCLSFIRRSFEDL